MRNIFFCNHIACKNSLFGCKRGGGGGETTSTSHTYYYYKVKFPHNNIDPSQSIILYNAVGSDSRTIPPYSSDVMNYGEGILSIPGAEQNLEVESIASASYFVLYSQNDLVIDYENAEFKIAKTMIKTQVDTLIQATYEYITVFTPLKDVASVIDSRWDTQVQTIFYSQPPQGYNYAILDLGAIYDIQALDIVAGFFKPDAIRKFDIDMNLTIQYSLDNVGYYEISDKTHNFGLNGGASQSFEEQDLGIGFKARYLKLILENVKKIEFGEVKDANGVVIQTGLWVVALTEIAAYNNIVVKSDIKLIPTSYTTSQITDTSITIPINSTEGFIEPESAETLTAYISVGDGTLDSFSYTGLTSTEFIGVSGIGTTYASNTMIVKEEEGDTTLYDYYELLPKLGDRLYKKNDISDSTLYTQTQLDYIAKATEKEFIKNHDKINIDVLYAPHIQIGQTLKLVDSYNNTSTRFFVESIKDNNGSYSLVLSRYPA